MERARDALEVEIAKRTGNTPQPLAEKKVTFGWFVRHRWLPLKEANWKEETARDKKCIIQMDLIGKFDNVPLENFDKFSLQVHLNDLAKTRSRDRVLQIRARPLLAGRARDVADARLGGVHRLRIAQRRVVAGAHDDHLADGHVGLRFVSEVDRPVIHALRGGPVRPQNEA